jgi:hypothetical protein
MATQLEVVASRLEHMVERRRVPKMRWLAIVHGVVLPLLLLACGGGGGSGSGSGSAPEPAPVVTSPPNIVADVGVPAASIAGITRLATPTGNANWGAFLAVVAGTGDARLPVVATNAEGQIVLAALANSSVVTLTAESTALALARLTFGRVPAGMDSTALDVAIRGSAGYATLEQRVSQALAAGQASSAAAPVLQALRTVLAQTADIVARRVAASTRTRPQAISPTRVSGDMPFTLFTGFGPLGSVYLLDSTNSGIRVVNTMPIVWAAQTYSATDQALAPKMAILPAASTLRAYTNATGWLDVDPVVLSDHGGRGIDLLIEQNSTTRLTNWIAIFTDAVSLYAGDGATPSCVENVVNTLLKGDELTALFESPSWSNVFNWLVGETVLERVKQALSATKTAASCFGGSAGRLSEEGAPFYASYIELLAEVGKPLDAAFTIADKVSLASKVAWTVVAMTYSERIGVCQSLDFGVWVIKNCAKTFEFTPAPLLLAPGARLLPTVSALDARGYHTGVPAGLVFNSPSSLISVDAATGKVSAGSGFGEATLSVIDPAAGGLGELAVSVVAAQLQPTSAELTVGETMRFALQDPLGRRIWHNGIEVQWASSAPQVASLAPLGRAPNTYPDSLDIDATGPGVTRVEVLNPLDPRGPQRATLVVKGQVQASLAVSGAPVLVGADTTLLVRVAPAAPDAAWDTSAWPVPKGVVSVRNGAGAVLCTRTLTADVAGNAAAASCQHRFDTAATGAALSVDYDGDDHYRKRSDAANTTLTIAASRVRLSGSTSPNPSASGAPITLSVSVSPDPLNALLPIPTGVITALNSRGGVVCQATLDAQGRASCVGAIVGNQGSEPLQVSYADSSATYLPALIDVPHQLVSTADFRTVQMEDAASGSDCRAETTGGGIYSWRAEVVSCARTILRVLQCSGGCFDQLPLCTAGDLACQTLRSQTFGYRYWVILVRDAYRYPDKDYLGKICQPTGWDHNATAPISFNPATVVIEFGRNGYQHNVYARAVGQPWIPVTVEARSDLYSSTENGVLWNGIGVRNHYRRVETLQNFQFLNDWDQFYYANASTPGVCAGEGVAGSDYMRHDVVIFDALTGSYRTLVLESSLP